MELTSISKKEKLLVLSIDRDNDIGEKAGIKGPIIGREAVLKAANSLGLADPEDTDFNALFETVRVYDELKKSLKPNSNNIQVAAITGDKDRGVKSGLEVGRQLDLLLKEYKATGAILVTDGKDDEHTIPLIQNKIPIKSIRRIIVRQADQLESSYFKIKDFLDESLDNPRFSSLIFGLPALMLILIGIFGIAGIRYVLVLLGVFLVIKWLKLEKHITGASEELQSSLSRRRFALFFVYMLGSVIGILGLYRGYTYIQSFIGRGLFEATAAFITSTIFIFWAAVVVGWSGRSAYKKSRSLGRILSVPIFGFAVALVLFGAADLIVTPSVTITSFLGYVVFGGLLIVLSVLIDKWSFLKAKNK